MVKLLEKSARVGLNEDSSRMESFVKLHVFESSSMEKDLFDVVPFCWCDRISAAW